MIVLDVVLVILAVAFGAGLSRAAIGPTIADRAVAADLCLFVLAGAFAILSVELGTPVFVDAILVATLLGFVATVSLAKLVWTRGVDDRDDEPEERT